MIIRKFEESDLTRLFEIYKKARTSALFNETTLRDISSFEQNLEGEDIFVICRDETFAGFISIYSAQSFIHHLYIDPAYQKQGLGKALLSHLRNKYDLPLSLKCEKKNEKAISFYRNSGWKFFNSGSEMDGTEYILLTLDLD